MKKKIRPKLYTLSTCVHCRATKLFLKEHNIDYDYIDVDMLNGKERDKARKDVMKISGGRFPTIIIGEKIIVGFQEDKLRKALGLWSYKTKQYGNPEFTLRKCQNGFNDIRKYRIIISEK